jgi:hypothetical protein
MSQMHQAPATKYIIILSGLMILMLWFPLTGLSSQNLGIDEATLKKKLTDVAVEKIFNGISDASEEQLKSVTYFNDLVRDLKPFGVELDKTNFNSTARDIYNKYKEAYEKEKDPAKAKQALKDMLKGDIKNPDC